MNRKRRTEVLIRSTSDSAKKLAAVIIGNYEISTLSEPSHGLVMIKVRETAQQQLFYLGEVFVTEARVKVAGQIGVGMVVGDQQELAYHLAIIDAAYAASLPETEQWSTYLLEEEQLISEQNIAEANRVYRTKVSFETMDV
ncbi:phosphonate C-P lyase system protein PhnG [Bacillaceae bacterium SAS-127]|nr:phosphonate C-P lyase system protein PhnG [Bacillaceae bacterium SAS-127]